MEKLRKIQRIGTVPFNSFQEQIRIVKMLRSQIKGNVRISVENSLNLVFYEYFELQ